MRTLCPSNVLETFFWGQTKCWMNTPSIGSPPPCNVSPHWACQYATRSIFPATVALLTLASQNCLCLLMGYVLDIILYVSLPHQYPCITFTCCNYLPPPPQMKRHLGGFLWEKGVNIKFIPIFFLLTYFFWSRRFNWTKIYQWVRFLGGVGGCTVGLSSPRTKMTMQLTCQYATPSIFPATVALWTLASQNCLCLLMGYVLDIILYVSLPHQYPCITFTCCNYLPPPPPDETSSGWVPMKKGC